MPKIPGRDVGGFVAQDPGVAQVFTGREGQAALAAGRAIQEGLQLIGNLAEDQKRVEIRKEAARARTEYAQQSAQMLDELKASGQFKDGKGLAEAYNEQLKELKATMLDKHSSIPASTKYIDGLLEDDGFRRLNQGITEERRLGIIGAQNAEQEVHNVELAGLAAKPSVGNFGEYYNRTVDHHASFPKNRPDVFSPEVADEMKKAKVSEAVAVTFKNLVKQERFGEAEKLLDPKSAWTKDAGETMAKLRPLLKQARERTKAKNFKKLRARVNEMSTRLSSGKATDADFAEIDSLVSTIATSEMEPFDASRLIAKAVAGKSVATAALGSDFQDISDFAGAKQEETLAKMKQVFDAEVEAELKEIAEEHPHLAAEMSRQGFADDVEAQFARKAQGVLAEKIKQRLGDFPGFNLANNEDAAVDLDEGLDFTNPVKASESFARYSSNMRAETDAAGQSFTRLLPKSHTPRLAQYIMRNDDGTPSNNKQRAQRMQMMAQVMGPEDFKYAVNDMIQDGQISDDLAIIPYLNGQEAIAAAFTSSQVGGDLEKIAQQKHPRSLSKLKAQVAEQAEDYIQSVRNSAPNGSSAKLELAMLQMLNHKALESLGDADVGKLSGTDMKRAAKKAVASVIDQSFDKMEGGNSIVYVPKNTQARSTDVEPIMEELSTVEGLRKHGVKVPPRVINKGLEKRLAQIKDQRRASANLELEGQFKTPTKKEIKAKFERADKLAEQQFNRQRARIIKDIEDEWYEDLGDNGKVVLTPDGNRLQLLYNDPNFPMKGPVTVYKAGQKKNEVFSIDLNGDPSEEDKGVADAAP